jgi:hypothetical protein
MMSDPANLPEDDWDASSEEAEASGIAGLRPELLEGPRSFYASLSGNQRRLMTLAIRESARLFPHDTDDDGRKDAVRHAYWSALLMFHLGLSNALAATSAHDAFAGPRTPPERRAMDDFNHVRGFDVGLGCPSDFTDRQILGRVMDLYQRGELKVLRPDAARAPRRR